MTKKVIVLIIAIIMSVGIVPAQFLMAQNNNVNAVNKTELIVEATNLTQTMVSRMQAEETRLQQILDKISSRNAHIKNNGIDTSPVGTMLVNCQIKIDSANTLIRALENDLSDLPSSPYSDRLIQSIIDKSSSVDTLLKETLALEKETIVRLKTISQQVSEL